MRTSVLGGESKTRGLFAGRRSRAAFVAWAVFAIAGAVTVMYGGLLAAVIVGVVGVALFFLLADTGSGSSTAGRVQRRVRMWARRRDGWDNFVPIAWRPADLVDGAGRTRSERRASHQLWNAHRSLPDGVDGLYWLEKRPGQPAVAYHSPRAGGPDAAFLTVAYAVDGPIKGLHGDGFVSGCQEAFGELLAGWGSAQKLVSGVQIVTRVLPADSAFHELWLEGELDPAAPPLLQREYGKLLDDLSANSFVQRHYVVVRWNLTPRFRRMSNRRAPGPQGWLETVQDQLPMVEHRLREARYSRVTALSGPRLAAVLRHLQHPDWPIDRASDVTPDTCWLPSHDEWAWTETVSEPPDPTDPTLILPSTSWYHRTAVIPAAALEVRELNGLWLAPLLIGMDEQIVRTIAVHHQLIPAPEAKVQARMDATSDRADLVGEARKGRLIGDGTELALSASMRRLQDLADGVGAHGDEWVAYITVSARSADELGAACAHIEEAADTAGISRLDWQDTLQSAAHANTWPLGRGIVPPRRSRSTRAVERLSGESRSELGNGRRPTEA